MIMFKWKFKKNKIGARPTYNPEDFITLSPNEIEQLKKEAEGRTVSPTTQRQTIQEAPITNRREVPVILPPALEADVEKASNQGWGVNNPDGVFLYRPVPIENFRTAKVGKRGSGEHHGHDFTQRHAFQDVNGRWKTDEEVSAAEQGVVVDVRYGGVESEIRKDGLTGYGIRVVVKHVFQIILNPSGGTTSNTYGHFSIHTLYAHLDRAYVKVGDTVKARQAIGVMGKTGVNYGRTGVHLHFEIFDTYSDFGNRNLYDLQGMDDPNTSNEAKPIVWIAQRGHIPETIQSHVEPPSRIY